MENYTPWEIIALFWSLLLGGASAFVLLSNAYEKFIAARKRAQAPNDAQNERLDHLEEEMQHVKRCLDMDKKRLDKLDKGNRATQRALLALLGHGIDGNNNEQMVKARDSLQEFLLEP